MGQLESVPSFRRVVKKDDGSFVYLSNEPTECLLFEPSESYMVSYGIDYQTSPKFKHKTLTSVTVADAQQVTTALESVGVINQGNAALYAASKQPEECTFEGMKAGFQKQAKKVEQNGLFVFHFSGHGIKVRNEEWGLAPVDFDYTRDTYITADVLNEWLQEVGCRAKHILFTLDCCYAGGIAKELTSSGNWGKQDLGLYVISACTANESSLVLGPLGHSIFTYFLAEAIARLTSHPGQLPVCDIFKECQICSVALSSLLISYDPTSGLSWSTMQPQMRVWDLKSVVMELMGEGPDQPDAVVLGRFNFAVQLYDKSKSIPSLDDKTYAWFETLSDSNGPLMELEKRHILEGRILDAALCSIMYSVASIEMACNPANVGNPNLFLVAFMHAVATLDLMKHGVEFNENQFVQSWGFYRDVIIRNKVNDEGLRQLLYKLKRKEKGNVISGEKNVISQPGGGGEEFTDSDEVGKVCDNEKYFFTAKCLNLITIT